MFLELSSVQSDSVQFSFLSHVCDSMDCSRPGFCVHHQLLELVQTHVCRIGDAIQPSHPLSSPSPPAFNLSQHQGLLQWSSSSYQVAKVLELQLHHRSFQWIFRTIFLIQTQFISVSNNSFIEISFTCHTIHLFPMYSLVILSILTKFSATIITIKFKNLPRKKPHIH